jgi:single-stranded DNA-binding protein
VFIEGRLHLDTWDDKQTGQKRFRLRVIGERLQLLGQPPKQPDKDLDTEPDDIPF